MTSEYEHLKHRISQNDTQALKEMYDLFGKNLLQFATTIVHSRELAEEIVQDVFVQIWGKRNQIGRIENLKFYLYITTRNISLTYLRKRKYKTKLAFDEVLMLQCQVGTTPEDLMITSEVLKKINLAISNLPPQCQLIFKLVKEDGLKYREVADILNLSSKTIENQMGIALKKLHAAMVLDLPAFQPPVVKTFENKKG